ncbi:MAG TPA: hypothetical protein VF658_10650 [Pyrinomonadaceae bacterium]
MALACALIAAILVASYFVFFRSPAQNTAGGEQRQNDAPVAVSTEAQIFEDEAIIKGSQAVVGGKVRNISREPLNDLSLELELKRRSDNSTEIRKVALQPNHLAPGEEGKYSITIARHEFSGAQVKHLKSAVRSTLIVFKTAPGARRPRELPPEPPTRTIITERPSPRPTGEEFINTPDTPTKVP